MGVPKYLPHREKTKTFDIPHSYHETRGGEKIKIGRGFGEISHSIPLRISNGIVLVKHIQILWRARLTLP